MNCATGGLPNSSACWQKAKYCIPETVPLNLELNAASKGWYHKDMAVNISEVMALPLAERLRLVEALWDSLAADDSEVLLTDWQRDELNRRIDEFERDGKLGTPWPEVIAKLKTAR
jgi:putative addiction module component (TIGR02574 family)